MWNAHLEGKVKEGREQDRKERVKETGLRKA